MLSATLMNEPTVPLMPMPGHLANPGIQQFNRIKEHALGEH